VLYRVTTTYIACLLMTTESATCQKLDELQIREHLMFCISSFDSNRANVVLLHVGLHTDRRALFNARPPLDRHTQRCTM